MSAHRRMAERVTCKTALGAMLFVVLLVFSACDEGRKQSSTRSAESAKRLAKPAQMLSFPGPLHVVDASVNKFVEQAMNACATGEYNDFRLLWSARQKPLERGEFEAGWLAVKSIEVRALELIKLATETERGEERLDEHYVFLADVRFDPQHPAGRKEPRREVVLLLTKEQQQWRLARAPAKIRTWIRERVVAQAEASAPTFPPLKPSSHDSGADGR